MYPASHAFHIHFTALESKKSIKKKEIKHEELIAKKSPKITGKQTSGPPVSCNIGKLRKNQHRTNM